jgi:hypothetical protein
MILQTRDTLLAIVLAPPQQTGVAAARNLVHLLGWVVGAVQTYCQKTGSRRTILAPIMRFHQFSNLVFSQPKSSFSHEHIIPSLSGLSIRESEAIVPHSFAGNAEAVDNQVAHLVQAGGDGALAGARLGGEQ